MRRWMVGWIGRRAEKRKKEAGRLVGKGAGPRPEEREGLRILTQSLMILITFL